MPAQDSGAADLMVIFGITGDLARKMTFRALYNLERRGLLDFPIVGVAGDELSVPKLVELARDSITGSGQQVDDAVFGRLASRLSYVGGDVTDSAVYRKLARKMGDSKTPLYYLEVPPSLFGPIVEQLAAARLIRGGRVAVEKPFGHDLESARELNARLHQSLDESQILRVDHFLAKQPVIELEYLRFANPALGELWDRKTVSAIQITMAEDFGVEDRGRFYDPVGALRDVVQNHLMQVLALVAMEPPEGGSAGDVQDQKAELFRAIPAADPRYYVRGQYKGYTDDPDVPSGSATETYAALRLEIDNWRWADVPIFMRAGKEMPERVTEVRLLLRRTPRLAFLPNLDRSGRNQVVLRIDPSPGMRIQLTALEGQSWRPVCLDTLFAADLGPPMEPYEVLLHAAAIGNHQFFTRQDSIEETWRIVQPLLDAPPPVRSYQPGSWGPSAANSLVRGHPGWQQPWLTGRD